MANYDFTQSLSPLDFELFSKDLLEAELGLRFENFKEGKDKGIDLRHSPQVGGGTVIVQCKRYGVTRFANLKSDLKLKELPKIQKLQPSRYILTTSIPLSPGESSELMEILSPFVISTDDIYGKDRLNSILEKHSDVLRRHNKLWMGSTAVIDAILNAGTHEVSRAELEETVAAAKLYVKNDSFDEALSILKEHHVCIISGIPGIGKTTLARMLLLYFEDLGFDLVKISGDVSEADGVAFHEKPKFYYYDDFLGQTSLSEKFNKNEESKLLAFMKRIGRSEKSVMVLTTREYILKQAAMVYEAFDRVKFDRNKCIIDLAKYSRRIKSQILYNHLYFSELPESFVQAIVTSRKYIDIVDHENYSPRLVSYLTNMEWLEDANESNYPEVFIENLDNPILLWKHAFDRQLRRSSQDLLIILSTFSYRAVLSDVEKAFNKFRQNRAILYGEIRAPEEFKDSLRELEGTFVKIQVVSGGNTVEFHNPSIRDFIEPKIFDDDVFKVAVDSLVFFEQASWCYAWLHDTEVPTMPSYAQRFQFLEEQMIGLYESPPCAVIHRLSESYGDQIFKGSPNLGGRLSNLVESGRRAGSTKGEAFAEAALQSIAAEVLEGKRSAHEATGVISYLSSSGLPSIGKDSALVAAIKRDIIEAPNEIDDFETIASLKDSVESALSEEELGDIQDKFDWYLQEYSGDLFGFNFEDPDQIRGVAERIEILGRGLGVDTTGAEADINERADEQQAKIDEQRDWDPNDDDRSWGGGSGEQFSDEDLDSMFGTLD